MGYNPPLIFGPIAPENNPSINPQFYEPSRFDIASIVNGSTTLVTTTVAHNYVTTQLIRFLIPKIYGGREFNTQQAYIISIPSTTQFIVALDSTNFSVFTAQPTSGTTQPQVIAIGDLNSGPINLQGRANQTTYIPGSFRDISNPTQLT